MLMCPSCKELAEIKLIAGIPSVFWDHIMDWGDEHRKKIGSLLKARRDSGSLTVRLSRSRNHLIANKLM